MPLAIPSLDDRTFDDLVREALDMIPSHAPEWTDHNASDPGITLLELLAYVTEMLIYRVNQIGDSHLRVFTELLTGKPSDPDRPVRESLFDAVRNLRLPARAVTCHDFERLAMAADPAVSLDPDPRIKRARCVADVDLELTPDGVERPGHVSVVIVPARKSNEPGPEPDGELLRHLHAKLEKYCLLTTRLHITGPRYVPVRLKAALSTALGVDESRLLGAARETLERVFDPVGRARDDHGWPFGRNIFLSSVYDVLERVPGVDHVAALEIVPHDHLRIKRNQAGQEVGIELLGHELPLVEITELTVRPPSVSAGRSGADHD